MVLVWWIISRTSQRIRQIDLGVLVTQQSVIELLTLLIAKPLVDPKCLDFLDQPPNFVRSKSSSSDRPLCVVGFLILGSDWLPLFQEFCFTALHHPLWSFRVAAALVLGSLFLALNWRKFRTMTLRWHTQALKATSLRPWFQRRERRTRVRINPVSACRWVSAYDNSAAFSFIQDIVDTTADMSKCVFYLDWLWDKLESGVL